SSASFPQSSPNRTWKRIPATWAADSRALMASGPFTFFVAGPRLSLPMEMLYGTPARFHLPTDSRPDIAPEPFRLRIRQTTVRSASALREPRGSLTLQFLFSERKNLSKVGHVE